MANASDRTRVQVTLDTGLVNDINDLCERAHMSRSAWIEYTLAMAVNTYRELLDSVGTGLLNEQQ